MCITAINSINEQTFKDCNNKYKLYKPLVADNLSTMTSSWTYDGRDTANTFCHFYRNQHGSILSADYDMKMGIQELWVTLC